MIQIVAFHVEPSQATANRIADSCVTFHADNDYLTLLDILFQSAALAEPRTEHVILTDLATTVPQLGSDLRVIRSSIDAERVMFSRLFAQIDFLKHHAGPDAVAFVDSDMIINAPLQPLFDEDFDIALTYRDNPAMPINGGVILVKGGRAEAAASLLQKVCDCYAEKFADQSHWWGDQHALIEVLGHERFINRTSDLLNIENVRVRLLPCEKYNFSPDNRCRAIAKPLHDKVILHFKGERKRLMPRYWNAHLACRNQIGWQAWWQAHRTRWGLRFAS